MHPPYAAHGTIASGLHLYALRAEIARLSSALHTRSTKSRAIWCQEKIRADREFGDGIRLPEADDADDGDG